MATPSVSEKAAKIRLNSIAMLPTVAKITDVVVNFAKSIEAKNAMQGKVSAVHSREFVLIASHEHTGALS